jgi:hypothetical protein
MSFRDEDGRVALSDFWHPQYTVISSFNGKRIENTYGTQKSSDRVQLPLQPPGESHVRPWTTAIPQRVNS